MCIPPASTEHIQSMGSSVGTQSMQSCPWGSWVQDRCRHWGTFPGWVLHELPPEGKVGYLWCPQLDKTSLARLNRWGSGLFLKDGGPGVFPCIAVGMLGWQG